MINYAPVCKTIRLQETGHSVKSIKRQRNTRGKKVSHYQLSSVSSEGYRLHRLLVVAHQTRMSENTHTHTHAIQHNAPQQSSSRPLSGLGSLVKGYRGRFLCKWVYLQQGQCQRGLVLFNITSGTHHESRCQCSTTL